MRRWYITQKHAVEFGDVRQRPRGQAPHEAVSEAQDRCPLILDLPDLQWRRPGVLTYAFLLLLLCVSLTVLGISLAFGGPGLESEDFDHALSIVELVLCATYLHLAVRTVYSAQGMSRILKVGALAFAVAGNFLGYRFALLLITLSAT